MFDNLKIMEKLKGAFYPDVMRMASFEVQVELGCDPAVLKFFSDRFILVGPPPGLQIAIFETEVDKWKEAEAVWRHREKIHRENCPALH